jgi:hypothetical protein
MKRIALLSVFGVLLAVSGTAMADQTASTREQLACAEVGIAQGSPAFAQCVADLDGSLSQLQQLDR